MAETLSSLASLLDDRINQRGVSSDAGATLAARHLGVPIDQVIAAQVDLSPLGFLLACRALARDLVAHPGTPTRGLGGSPLPRWSRFELAEGSELVPTRVAVDFAPGTVVEAPLVVETEEDYGDFTVRVLTRREHEQAAQAYLDALVARGRGRDNPFRGRMLEATMSNRGLVVRVVANPEESREQLVLPDAVWRAVDTNVHGLFRQRELLDRAGLGSNRGVLLAGPPGVGKTAVARVLAAELVGEVTVVFCDARLLESADELYKEVAYLTPALVIMEDIDLVLARRDRASQALPLQRFLVALDGLLSRHHGIVTIATTNDPNAIDPAARRACRFDVVVDVPPPDETARGRILRTCLAPLGADFDVAALAAATAGASGADLKELVRLAVLSTGGCPTLDVLLQLAGHAAGRERPTGQYL